MYGLIGYPLSHSFSEKYFTEKFYREDIREARFLTFSLPEINLLPNLLQEHGDSFKGFAVTIPHKRNVLAYLDNFDETVRTIQACNCVRICNGKLIGTNTDVIGFKESFSKHLRPELKSALVLGSGGASAAVCFVLEQLGISYKIVSRDKPNGDLTYPEIDNSILDEFKIIVNASPVGTYPNVNDAPSLPYQWLTGNHYLFDLVYNPSETLFLKYGKEKGAIVENGYEMLVLQAEENWKFWNRGLCYGAD